MKTDVSVKTKFSFAHFFLLLIPMQIIVFGCFFAYRQYVSYRRLFFDNEQFEKNCAIAYLCEIMSNPYIHQDICDQYSSCLEKTNSKGWFTEGIPDCGSTAVPHALAMLRYRILFTKNILFIPLPHSIRTTASFCACLCL